MDMSTLYMLAISSGISTWLVVTGTILLVTAVISKARGSSHPTVFYLGLLMTVMGLLTPTTQGLSEAQEYLDNKECPSHCLGSAALYDDYDAGYLD